MSGRFTRVTFLVIGPLLGWLACFTGIYVLGAIACARGLAQLRVAGVGFVGAVTAGLVLVAAALTAWRMASALRQYRSRAHGERFTAFLTLSLGALALLALVLLAMPVLITRPACAGQPVFG